MNAGVNSTRGPSGPPRPTSRRLRRLLLIALPALLAAALAPGPGAATERARGALAAPGAAAGRAPVKTLVNERFTGATADSRFHGYGTACLTGAARGRKNPGRRTHPLGGCGSYTSGPVPPGSAAPHGYLQLTDAGRDRHGAVLFDAPVPAEDGLKVTFEQWQYGLTSRVPADGISFFLTDGSRPLSTPGPFGGSLGYAQKLPDDEPGETFLPGVGHGYLGVGLDVLGNFFGDWEKRGNGCAKRSPAGTGFHVPAPGANMVTVRGPGNGTKGYCWLDATTSNRTTTRPWPSTLPGDLQGPLLDMPPGVTPQQAEQLLEPSRRTVQVEITPGPDPRAVVEIDFQDGAGFQKVLELDAPKPVPASYRFGFAASTGLYTDVHLIRHLVVKTQRPPAPGPRLAIAKRADRATVRPGRRIQYTITARNTGDGDFTKDSPARLTDDLRRVLRYARYGHDAKASTGKVVFRGTRLEWHGPLASRKKATITFSVRVNPGTRPGVRIRNTLASKQAQCGAACTVETVVLPKGKVK
ncbi:hypothetical protein ACIBF1_31110 [Spirillospora sp. NPDC050679]